MVTIEEALKIIAEQKIEQQTESRSLEDCPGFCLSEVIVAPFDMPSFDNSAMDGYALCGSYTEYRLIGEVAAGDSANMRLKDGEAVRIFTGARVPENATAVMMQEKTSVQNERLILEEAPKAGQCIRKKGEELRKDQEVFEQGYKITPAGVGLIGSLGIEKVKVFRKPAINLITTGNELIQPGQAKSVGQIYESNSFALEAACNQFGFRCNDKRQIEDDFQKIKSGIGDSLESADVLILSGGISVGDYDFVKQALEENGVEQLFYKVFQKPGKPLYFGRKGNKFVFALPGNPASSLSCFYMYVIPFLQKFSGNSNTESASYHFPLKEDFENRSDRPTFLKANVENNEAEILNGQSSSMIQSMALGNALAYIGAKIALKKGDKIKCFLIS